MSEAPTGNPVFDYKAGFRRASQSIQRMLWFSGWLLIAAGLLSLVLSLKDRALLMALRYSPLMGLGLVLASAVWAFVWRAKLRADFRREFSASRARE